MEYIISEDISKTVYNVIKYSIIAGISFGFVLLTITSILIHDTHYIEKNPKFFVSETVLMGLLTAIPIVFISKLRGGSSVSDMKQFTLFFLKIALLHIGFQLSGVYSVIFPKSA
jgi:hypothetical protein